MNKKSRSDVVLTVIMAMLLAITCIKIVHTEKIYTTYREELKHEAERQEEITAEIKQEVDRSWEIYGIYVAALDRNSAAYERLIQLLEQMTQEGGEVTDD